MTSIAVMAGMNFVVLADNTVDKAYATRYKDLDAGINEINIPDDFSVENANTVKVMVWNNLEDIVPLFEAYEKIKS